MSSNIDIHTSQDPAITSIEPLPGMSDLCNRINRIINGKILMAAIPTPLSKNEFIAILKDSDPNRNIQGDIIKEFISLLGLDPSIPKHLDTIRNKESLYSLFEHIQRFGLNYQGFRYDSSGNIIFKDRFKGTYLENLIDAIQAFIYVNDQDEAVLHYDLFNAKRIYRYDSNNVRMRYVLKPGVDLTGPIGAGDLILADETGYQMTPEGRRLDDGSLIAINEIKTGINKLMYVRADRLSFSALPSRYQFGFFSRGDSIGCILSSFGYALESKLEIVGGELMFRVDTNGDLINSEEKLYDYYNTHIISYGSGDLLYKSMLDKDSQTNAKVYIHQKYLDGGVLNLPSDYRENRKKYRDMFLYSEQAIVGGVYIPLTLTTLPSSLWDIRYISPDSKYRIYALPDGSIVNYEALGTQEFTLMKGTSFIYATHTLSNGAGAIVDTAQSTFGLWPTFMERALYNPDINHDSLLGPVKATPTESQKNTLDAAKESIRNIYLTRTANKEVIYQYLKSLGNLPYTNLDFKNLFLKDLGEYADELKLLQDLSQIGCITGKTKRSLYMDLPARTLEATTAGRIDGKLIIKRIEKLLRELIAQTPYPGAPHWGSASKPDEFFDCLIDAYSKIDENDDIRPLPIQSQVDKIVEYIGSFVFLMFLIDGVEVRLNSDGKRWDFCFKRWSNDHLLTILRQMNVKVYAPNALSISVAILTYNSLELLGMSIKIKNDLTSFKGQLLNMFSSQEKTLPSSAYTITLIDTLHRVQKGLFDWIDDTYTDYNDRMYYKNRFRRRSTNIKSSGERDWFHQVLLELNRMLPAIQSHHLVEDKRGFVEVLKVGVDVFKLSSELLYDLNLVELIYTIDSKIKFKGGWSQIQSYRDIEMAVKYFYDDFYSKFVPFLEDIAHSLDEVTFCDGHTLYFDITRYKDLGFVRLSGNNGLMYQSKSYFKLDFSEQDSAEFRANMYKLFCAFMDHYHVRLFAFDLTGKRVLRQNTLLIFGWMGVQASNRDGDTGENYIQGAITGEYLQGIADIFDDLITDFMSQGGLPTAVNSMEDMLALNRLLFVKTLLTAKKTPSARIKYFKKNIDKGFCKKFREMAPLWGIDIDAWNEWHKWYEIYIDKNVKIDEEAIIWFLSIMIDEDIDVIRKWFKDTKDYDFENMYIKMEPWFKPEFLVLHKYFPNVQYVN